MPSYDYRCQSCGRELVIFHRMSESVTEEPHSHLETDAPCPGPLERLISSVGLAKSVGQKPPSDSKLKSAGFTKYVRGPRGYEKAFGGKEAPDFIKRD
jgi:putative FmdB family regulatory protein